MLLPAPLLSNAFHACRRSFINAALFSFFINLAMLVPAIYMLQVYDRVIPSANASTLILLTLLMLVFMAAMGILEWARSELLRRIGNRLDTACAEVLFETGYRQVLGSGRRLSGTQPLQDLKAIRQFLATPGIFAFLDTPWIPVYLLVMFAFHPVMGTIGLASALLLLGITWLNERLTAKHQARAEDRHADAANMAAQYFRNAEIIASLGMLPPLRQRWYAANQTALQEQNLAAQPATALTALSKTLRIVIQSLILGVGAYLAIEQHITAGMMVAASILLGRTLAPVDQLLGVWKQFITVRHHYQRLTQVLHEYPPTGNSMPLPAPRGEIRVDIEAVIPPGSDQPVLYDTRFITAAGTITGIIGPSGAGKSSLARVLLGIWPCAKGSVRLDGVDIHTWNKAELGPYLGYLPQDIELFAGTIRENIARFRHEGAEKVIAAAQLCGLHEFILSLPAGYDTPIGHDGLTLSGGQRQRLGLARAVYGLPRVLVLDEPNSNLDHQGEQALAQVLQHLKHHGSTVFLITHKMQALAHVDRLLVIDQHTLSMAGPRDAVLAELNKAPQRVAAAPGIPFPKATVAS